MKRLAGICCLGLLLLAVASFLAPPQAPTPYAFPEMKGFPALPHHPANPVTVEGVQLGRMLFYDPILSRDSAMSCASCHRQAAAFSDAPRRLSTDRFGTPLARNTLPLFNLAWYPAFFWDGRAGSLEAQVFQPVTAHRELNLSWKEAVRRLRRSRRYPPLFRAAFGSVPIDSVRVAYAIAQFERTLLSYRSKYDRVLNGEARFTRAEAVGFELVSDLSMGGCFRCHDFDGHALGTVPGFSNNGLDAAGTFADKGRLTTTGQAADEGAFKVPSLRNIALTPPYMHDGRFRTLEEVLRFYQSGVHGGPATDDRMNSLSGNARRLSDGDLRNILAFLRTLTDSAFIADPALANPW